VDKPDKKQVILDYLHTFNTECGKRVLTDLSDFCYANGRSTPCNLLSSRETDFNLGKFEVVRYIRLMLEKDPNEHVGDAIMEETNAKE
jgi:hypothetical protein